VQSLRKGFESAIDEYLDECAIKIEAPQKPYMGVFNVRVSPELHRSLAKYSFSHGQTLNSTVEKAFTNFVATHKETSNVNDK
jgi:predicted HicB family RNase H-like nuclease